MARRIGGVKKNLPPKQERRDVASRVSVLRKVEERCRAIQQEVMDVARAVIAGDDDPLADAGHREDWT